MILRGPTRNLAKHLERGNGQKYTLDSHGLHALLVVLSGKEYEDQHLDRVRHRFPVLFAEKN